MVRSEAFALSSSLVMTRLSPKPVRSVQPAAGPGIASLLILVALQVVLAFSVSRSGAFTSGSKLGYWIGVAGAVMMLALLIYPLRKHLRVLNRIGSMRFWFALHMACGIFGPLLVLVHSTFHIGSLNAGVALISMLLVAASGIIGRFIYVRIHHGLYGVKATLRELQAKLGFDEADVKSRLHDVAPDVEARLLAFEAYALKPDSSSLQRTWRLLTLDENRIWTYAVAYRELGAAYRRAALARGWDEDKLERRLVTARLVVGRYLKNVRDVAQFSTYERLFSLWHILHVPLVYMLAISSVVHVVAVHMY